MTWWRRLSLCCLPWLVLGCPRFAFGAAAVTPEVRVAQELETASFNVWTEERTTFSGLRPETAARAWEANLRSLNLKPLRTGNLVECQTPEGYAFTMSFWDSKAAGPKTVQGEIVWHDRSNAGQGMMRLLEMEKKRGKEETPKKSDRWTTTPGHGIELLSGKQNAREEREAAPSGLLNLIFAPTRTKQSEAGILPAGTRTPDLNIRPSAGSASPGALLPPLEE